MRFMLMLLEVSTQTLKKKSEKKHLINKIVIGLQNGLRQTDVIGWYKYRKVIGIIFTDLSMQSNHIDIVKDRVLAALQKQITRDQIDFLSISLYQYPPHNSIDREVYLRYPIYPDVSKKKIKRLSKRLIDLFGSISLFLFFMPLFCVICLAIKLTSQGPILFRQVRIGQYGVPFTLFKFRSMYTHSNSQNHEMYVRNFILWSKQDCGEITTLQQDGLFKLTNDSRITPLGAYLRKTSIDELPQLINVFLGQMSLVGPRPPLQYEVECYEAWHMRRFLEAKPGLTGLWQVKGRSRTTFDDMVRLDLTYIDAWSTWTDIKILLQTPMAVLRGEGAR